MVEIFFLSVAGHEKISNCADKVLLQGLYVLVKKSVSGGNNVIFLVVFKGPSFLHSISWKINWKCLSLSPSKTLRRKFETANSANVYPQFILRQYFLDTVCLSLSYI